MSNQLESLLRYSSDAILLQRAVTLTHPPEWKRDGFPLPIKRNKPDADGSVTQDYRPMAIIEYVNDVLSGQLAARRAKDRAAQKEQA